MKKIMSVIVCVTFAAALSFCTKPHAEQGRDSQNPPKPDPYPANGSWDSAQNSDTTSNEPDTTRNNNR